VYQESDYTVIKATSLAYDVMQIWVCHKPQTPEPTDRKFDVGDYIGHIIPHAKIHNNRPNEGIPAHASDRIN